MSSIFSGGGGGSLFSGSGRGSLFSGSGRGSLFSGSGSGSFRTPSPPALLPEELAAYLEELRKRQLGKPTGTGGRGGIFGGVGRIWDAATPDILSKALEQIGTSLIYMLPGIYQIGKAVGSDLSDLTKDSYWTSGAWKDPGESEVLRLGKMMGQGIYEDFRHPRENPGYLALDLLALGSLGAGAVSRTSAAARAFREAGYKIPEGPPGPAGPSIPARRPLPPSPQGTVPAPPSGSLFRADRTAGEAGDAERVAGRGRKSARRNSLERAVAQAHDFWPSMASAEKAGFASGVVNAWSKARLDVDIFQILEDLAPGNTELRTLIGRAIAERPSLLREEAARKAAELKKIAEDAKTERVVAREQGRAEVALAKEFGKEGRAERAARAKAAAAERRQAKELREKNIASREKEIAALYEFVNKLEGASPAEVSPARVAATADELFATSPVRAEERSLQEIVDEIRANSPVRAEGRSLQEIVDEIRAKKEMRQAIEDRSPSEGTPRGFQRVAVEDVEAIIDGGHVAVSPRGRVYVNGRDSGISISYEGQSVRVPPRREFLTSQERAPAARAERAGVLADEIPEIRNVEIERLAAPKDRFSTEVDKSGFFRVLEGDKPISPSIRGRENAERLAKAQAAEKYIGVEPGLRILERGDQVMFREKTTGAYMPEDEATRRANTIQREGRRKRLAQELAEMGADARKLALLGKEWTPGRMGISPAKLEKAGIPRADAKKLSGELHDSVLPLYGEQPLPQERIVERMTEVLADHPNMAIAMNAEEIAARLSPKQALSSRLLDDPRLFAPETPAGRRAVLDEVEKIKKRIAEESEAPISSSELDRMGWAEYRAAEAARADALRPEIEAQRALRAKEDAERAADYRRVAEERKAAADEKAAKGVAGAGEKTAAARAAAQAAPEKTAKPPTRKQAEQALRKEEKRQQRVRESREASPVAKEAAEGLRRASDETELVPVTPAQKRFLEENFAPEVSAIMEDIERVHLGEPPLLRKPGARRMGTNPRNVASAIGISSKEATKLSGEITRKTRDLYERRAHNPSPDEIRDTVQKVLEEDPKTKARAKELADELYDEMAGVEQTTTQGGSLEAQVAKVAGQDAASELAAKARPLLQEAFARGAPRAMELRNIWHSVAGTDLGELIFNALYRLPKKPGMGIVQGPGISPYSQAKLGAAVKAFFTKPRPRDYLLTRRLTSSRAAHLGDDLIGDQQQLFGGELLGPRRAFVEGAAGMEQIPVELSRNVAMQGLQKLYFRWLEAAQEGSRRAGLLNRKFEFELETRSRLEKFLEGIPITPDEIAEEIAARGYRRFSFPNVIDSMNQLSQIMVLYTKPGYLPPNMLGQLLFTTIDHVLNPIAMTRNSKLYFEMMRAPDGSVLGKTRERLRNVMGEGLYASIGPAPYSGAFKTLSLGHQKLARGFGKVLDDPFRQVSFFNEARRWGYKSMDDVVRLANDPLLHEDFVSIARNANRNIVDYGRMNNIERAYLRRVLFFYPWLKGSTVWTGRFLKEHPAQFLTQIQAGRIGQEETEALLGKIPSYIEGSIAIGSREVPGLGRVPKLLSPQAISITGAAGEFIQGMRGLLFGDVAASEQLSEFFPPHISAGLAAATRTNPFTGAKYASGESPGEIFLNEYGKAASFARGVIQQSDAASDLLGIDPGKAGLIERGELDPRETLFPTTRGEEFLKWATGITPKTYNPREGQQRAFAELKGIEPAMDREGFKWDDRIRVSTEEAVKSGIIKQGQQLPPQLLEALQNKSARAQGYVGIAERRGVSERDLRHIDRLEADLNTLVDQGKMSQGQARALLIQYASRTVNDISNLRRSLSASFFGQSVLDYYRRLFISRGANMDNIDWAL